MRSPQGYHFSGGYIAGSLLILVMVSLIIVGLMCQHNDPVDEPTTEQAASAPSSNDDVNDGHEEVKIPSRTVASLSEEVRARTIETIKLYGSFPNQDGKQASLEKLRPLVSNAAFQNISAEWTGPDVTTVVYTVTSVVITSEQEDASDNSIVIRARATQQAVFSNTPSQIFTPEVEVILIHDDSNWIIDKIGYP